jgi:hypothetical protein
MSGIFDIGKCKAEQTPCQAALTPFLEALKHWVEERTPARPLGILGRD